jgi:peptide-methionine (S)-S-oxide reductase
MRLPTLLVLSACLLLACSGSPGETDGASSRVTSMPEKSTPAAAPGASAMSDNSTDKTPMPAGSTEVATFGAGCFWCVEAVLEQLDGVTEVTSGYMGGEKPDPSYEAVCSGTTGHAEVVQVTFDPARISYEELLDFFWRLHDPTTLNRQGADIGTQYRSAIFYHSEAQRAAAAKSMAAAQQQFIDPIVTEITAAGPFYSAEGYHQDYYRQNKNQSYCRVVIRPKLDKLGLEK